MPDSTTYLHVSPSFGTGGREMRTVALMGMTAPDVVHRVVALDGDTSCLARLAGGARVEVEADAPSGGGFLGRIGRIRSYLRERAPNLLLTYNWGATEWLLAARLERLVAVVHTEDGFGPEESGRQLRRRVWFRRLVLPVCRAVAVPSRTLFEIARRVWRQPERRLRYLPNGVDVGRFRPSAPVEREIVFGCVGRIRPEKNQVLAVEAFARCACRTRARLRLVGDGEQLAAVRRRADELGIGGRVDFVGNVDDTAPEYGKIDVFLIPSRTEQMPIALLEAMAAGLPVVGTDVGDVREIVAESNRAWIGEFHTPESLSPRLDAIAADAALRARIGAENRARVEREFELKACFGAWVRLWEEVAALRGAKVRRK